MTGLVAKLHPKHRSKVAGARAAADRLEAEGHKFDAEQVRRLVRAYIAQHDTLGRLHGDNIELRNREKKR